MACSKHSKRANLRSRLSCLGHLMLCMLLALTLVATGVCGASPSRLALAYAEDAGLANAGVEGTSAAPTQGAMQSQVGGGEVSGGSGGSGSTEGSGGSGSDSGSTGGSGGEGAPPTDPENPDPVDPDPVDPAATVTEIHLFYKTAAMEDFAAYVGDSETPAYIDTRQGSCYFDAQVVYADGSVVMAGESDLDIDWKFTSDSYAKYASIVEDLLPDESGDMKVVALGQGNSANLRITGSYQGVTVAPDNTRVKITSNDEQVVPVGPSLYYSDWKTSYDYLPDGGSAPQVVMYRGEMTSVDVSAYVFWSNGMLTLSGDGFVRAWNLEYCTNSKGEVVTPFCQVSGGSITANAGANGYAYLTCTLTSPDYLNVTYTQHFCVQVTSNASYVTNIEIVNASGESYGTGINLPDGDNIRYLFAKVTYKVYDEDAGTQSTVTKTSMLEDIEGLTWHNYRGESMEDELYSELLEYPGYVVFKANSGFKRARVVATVEGGSYFGEDVSADLWISHDVDDEDIGSTSTLRVVIYHESDYAKFGDDAPVAREVTVTREQLASLGNLYSDWYTFHGRNDSWSTVYASGITIGNFLSIVGVDSSDLCYIEFLGSDGYKGTDGFYSASTILSTQYRYSNYYMHMVSSNASYLGQSLVAPMIALEYYVSRNNDYDGSGWSKMTPDSTVRIVMGMTSPTATNAAKSVSCIDCVKVVIVDQPDEDSGGGGGSGGGEGDHGAGDDSGGGTGANDGSPTQGQGGGAGTGGQADSAAKDGAGSILLYEMSETQQELEQVIARAQLDNPWLPLAFVLIGIAFIAGALSTKRRFDTDNKRGTAPNTQGR